jgi:DNA-binding protein Fis
VLSRGEVLTREDFAFLESETVEPDATDLLRRLIEHDVQNALENRETGEIYRAWLDRVERPLLETVLTHTDGNQIRAAALLGINRNTLRKKIADLGIALPGRK